MSDRARRKLPLGEGDVPDKALQELLAAFASDQPTDAVPIDLEDPAIDIMLGLTQAVPVASRTSASRTSGCRASACACRCRACGCRPG
jgi:hypothetical protein